MKHRDFMNDGPRPKVAHRKADHPSEAGSEAIVPEQKTSAEDPGNSFRLRGDHCLTVYVSYEVKNRLKTLGEKYDRSTADMLRAVLKVGIPMMEGLSQAEEIMVKEYIELFRRLRQVKSLKEV